jgi:polygalacturonase
MTVTGCEKLSFKDSRFKGNKEFHGFVLHDSAAIEFCNCLIEGNKAKGPLFEATSCSKVTVSGGTINGNTYTKLMDPAGSVKTDKVDFAGNKTAAEPKE